MCVRVCVCVCVCVFVCMCVCVCVCFFCLTLQYYSLSSVWSWQHRVVQSATVECITNTQNTVDRGLAIDLYTDITAKVKMTLHVTFTVMSQAAFSRNHVFNMVRCEHVNKICIALLGKRLDFETPDNWRLYKAKSFSSGLWQTRELSLLKLQSPRCGILI